MRPDAVLSGGQDGLASSHFLLSMVADRIDLARESETSYEFTRRFEVSLPSVVVLATCCLTHGPSTVVLNHGVG